MNLITTFIIILFVLLFTIELSHSLRKQSPLKLSPIDWLINVSNNKIIITGWLHIKNTHKRIEVMIPSLKIKPKVLSKREIGHIKSKVRIITEHPDEENRKDNYWQAYIVKSNKDTKIKVEIILEEEPCINDINILSETIWIDVIWENYGPFGIIKNKEGFVLPISKPFRNTQNDNWIKSSNGSMLLPIKTHILGKLDNPYDVINEYCSKIIKPGDILTIGETPLAIMQGRYISPTFIKTSFISRILCLPFHPTSSLATACGMQSLINIIGPTRAITSLFFGSIFKLIGIKGIFYRLAGKQARLIDDITGTTPPYDQTIVLGPIKENIFCYEASKNLGIDIAIVDVNDLGKVKVLETTDQSNVKFLKHVLSTNPAGNGNQQTPIVLIRPFKK
ncbi:F420-0:Gamma-glutamyl ligase [Prochlorococcus sp. MIT 1223]|uniref:F420-0:Gamma-glutamyl ligase n=1 Tax=Prochlorococcus sp. MIT 1223 TaxID=3096217 RepID=UPI002A74E279|nr:F420-0:Gamma-glutamyl ligase [Prochlorococcus sp. MIT 1223]